MADLKEDRIDFSKLERELEQAVEKDARYWRENDAKFRAVEQRVESYEQFRDIVAASHIKPLDKKDKIGEGKRKQPWNPFTSQAAGPEPSTKPEESSKKETTKLPKTSAEFSRDWKRRCKIASEKYDYLKSIGAHQLGQIFRAEIGFGLLGEMVTVLNGQFQAGDAHCVADVLASLTQTSRFGLSLDFLSLGEKEQCGELFEKLEQEAEYLESGNLRPAEDATLETCMDEKRDNLEKEKDSVKDQLTSLRKLYVMNF